MVWLMTNPLLRVHSTRIMLPGGVILPRKPTTRIQNLYLNQYRKWVTDKVPVLEIKSETQGCKCEFITFAVLTVETIHIQLCLPTGHCWNMQVTAINVTHVDGLEAFESRSKEADTDTDVRTEWSYGSNGNKRPRVHALLALLWVLTCALIQTVWLRNLAHNGTIKLPGKLKILIQHRV
jgi:hypothetical protein